MSDEQELPELDFAMWLPECCRNGDPDCPHVVNKDERKKKPKNIGL